MAVIAIELNLPPKLKIGVFFVSPVVRSSNRPPALTSAKNQGEPRW